MKSLFIAALTNIKVPGLLGKGIVLSRARCFTNESGVVVSLLTPQFQETIGKLETTTLRNAGAVIYEIDEMDLPPEPRPRGLGALEHNLNLTQLFLLCLWLTKDNSVNCEIGFIEFPHMSTTSTISSNAYGALYSDATGHFSLTEFGPDEIRTARDHYTKLFEADKPRFAFSHISPTMPRDMNRLDRVLYYAQAARAAANVGIKIANYVTCYETLFSTDPSELAHKLAERVAVFHGGTPDERIAIYEHIKKAYAIRSKTVHGDSLSSQQEAMASDLAVQCDVLLRAILIKVLTSPDLRKVFMDTPAALDGYMLRRLVGAS